MFVEHILTRVAHNMVCVCLREKCEVTLAVPRCQHGVKMRWDPAIAFHEYIVPAALNEPDSQTAKDHQMSLCQCQNHILLLSPCGISKIMAELNPLANLAARQVFWGYDILILLSFNLLRELSPAAKWPRRGSLAHLGHPCLSSPQHREAPWSTPLWPPFFSFAASSEKSTPTLPAYASWAQLGPAVTAASGCLETRMKSPNVSQKNPKMLSGMNVFKQFSWALHQVTLPAFLPSSVCCVNLSTAGSATATPSSSQQLTQTTTASRLRLELLRSKLSPNSCGGVVGDEWGIGVRDEGRKGNKTVRAAHQAPFFQQVWAHIVHNLRQQNTIVSLRIENNRRCRKLYRWCQWTTLSLRLLCARLFAMRQTCPRTTADGFKYRAKTPSKPSNKMLALDSAVKLIGLAQFQSFATWSTCPVVRMHGPVITHCWSLIHWSAKISRCNVLSIPDMDRDLIQVNGPQRVFVDLCGLSARQTGKQAPQRWSLVQAISLSSCWTSLNVQHKL